MILCFLGYLLFNLEAGKYSADATDSFSCGSLAAHKSASQECSRRGLWRDALFGNPQRFLSDSCFDLGPFSA